ncbi:electron transport complex protein RnfB [Panacagrimonas perspica]|uniref:Electron transport complex protein RnfB n=2 Tax=Panacagrimonas perspica TaxID=381431 RepID=A0A4S3KAB4_9GAMM|nr:electron transport complex protein RnfB [Panacagrimonas perspica]THD05272.1 electron transporter RnfB [Panacagrimonas perspica]
MAGLADVLDALLPQTQCTRCGYPACRPYAEAIAAGEAGINRCPPGGVAGIERLAHATGRTPMPLDADCGAEKTIETVARIVEADCIGCTKCIQACPVDAIVGAMNLMHTVIRDECNGCDLCLPVCPVDCIVMEPVPGVAPAFERAAQFRDRHVARARRLEHRAAEDELRRRQRKSAAPAIDPVAAALARLGASSPQAAPLKDR